MTPKFQFKKFIKCKVKGQRVQVQVHPVHIEVIKCKVKVIEVNRCNLGVIKCRFGINKCKVKVIKCKVKGHQVQSTVQTEVIRYKIKVIKYKVKGQVSRSKHSDFGHFQRNKQDTFSYIRRFEDSPPNTPRSRCTLWLVGGSGRQLLIQENI